MREVTSRPRSAERTLSGTLASDVTPSHLDDGVQGTDAAWERPDAVAAELRA